MMKLLMALFCLLSLQLWCSAVENENADITVGYGKARWGENAKELSRRLKSANTRLKT